jgi:hypothetical protein
MFMSPLSLSQIFEKPIDRSIEGVIKADDEAFLRLEVEEYVLTNEVAKRLETFLEAYNDYQGANGVWISGFFGSGKSHLLKMLALLLENRAIGEDGTPVLDLFLPKVADNTFLKAELARAVAVPSRSILFNIDQKADVISKTQMDALLAVFVKVFDEMCGYYGKQGYIAQFERDLDSRGLYEDFRAAFRARSGLEWVRGREQALLEAHHIAAAYAQVTGMPEEDAAGILDKYRDQYRVSIEDFAEQVDDYITRQGPDFRLNFFVDEVGQYIADHVKLMTNLQTVAESLATKCRGRAWLIVTAQEDMQTVFGETGQQQSDDFSKIQARFATRMKLTSADVAEVIRKRLLSKNPRGQRLLADIYKAEKNNFKTLFDFAEGSQTYRNFRDRAHFVGSYPFIPYQFVLFQSAIQSLSAHNAFEGKHSSVGERSMLAVFQQVAMHIAEHEVGQLATFDLMFEGIRTALKSGLQRSILTAERHLQDTFAVRVLKALFLVKYVEAFKATPRNMTVLMLDSFETDLPALRRRVEEALNLLEQQTYVQRNAEEYEYLTDEEKDVEQEIKNTEVETAAVADLLGGLIFDHVIKNNKIRYEENGQDYAFSRKLDDRLLSREYELAIHVISPFHEHAGNESVLRSQALGRDELLVLMPPSDRLVRDLLMYKRTEKYIRQNISVAQQDSVKRILTNKQYQNSERLGSLRALVPELLAQAQLIVAGRDLEVNGSDARSRIVRGFYTLLKRAYPNLRMLRGISYTQADVERCLQPSAELFGAGAPVLGEAEQELLNTVKGNERNGLRTTMQSLVQRFEHKPYGWFLAAIQCLLAKLCARGKIEVRRDGALLEDEAALAGALRNTRAYAHLILEPQQDFTPGQVRWLRDFYADFFDGPPQANEAKSLGQETAQAFDSLQQQLHDQAQQAPRYPFLAALAPAVERLEGLAGQPYPFYLTELRRQEDALFDLKEQVIDPIRRFMGGAQREIYDAARRFLENQEANLSYVEGDAAGQMRDILADPDCYRGDRMQQVKRLLDGLRARVEAAVERHREETLRALAERWARLPAMAEFQDLTSEQQAALRRPFDELERSIEQQKLIAVMRDRLYRFDETQYPELLRRMTTWAQPAPPPDAEGERQCREKPVEYVARQSLRVPFDLAWLEDEDDVERYLAALREALLEAIGEGKRVQI